jgi:putative membrane-bound dehydrogenase-like protein
MKSIFEPSRERVQRMRICPTLTLLLAIVLASDAHAAADGNRLTYLDGTDPYYVSRRFPKLVTPQWIGEPGVEAAVILAIDDMRDPKKYEGFLRPILRRLQQIDSRAPVSIMTNRIDPQDPQLQAWLKEGLSLETHTIDHPCPLLQKGDFARAKATYDRCVDLMSDVPGNRPVAFRMPCCDSLNTVSPRFFAEIFNKTTPDGRFLTIDSSVFNVLTSNDPVLPRDWVIDADGQDKFRKYLPSDRSFVNTVEDYPYPFVINRLCWEFPCVTPSDWEANHFHKAVNPLTVRDWKAALDCIVLKQGVFCLVFHPHGWIKNEQIVELIDHAVAKHGKRVKFLTFREAEERLTKNFLGGVPLRDPKTGEDNGVRILDLNNDGYMDVVIGNEDVRKTRLWSPRTTSWRITDFPDKLVVADPVSIPKNRRGRAAVHFGVLQENGYASLVTPIEDPTTAVWHFDGLRWVKDASMVNGIPRSSMFFRRFNNFPDDGVRFRDIDGDGRCELIITVGKKRGIFTWSSEAKSWRKLPFDLPVDVSFNSDSDAGLRFIDIDGDGYDDIIVSNEREYGLYLFENMKEGWSPKVVSGKPGDKGALPMIARNGANNGAWFHSRHLWVQNENTALLKDLVDRRSFNDLLETVEPGPKSPIASLRSIQTRPGFEVELVASEPLVQSPIAFAWGPDGKLWVVEMGDYPLGADGKGKPGGRIKYLEDTKGTGHYDKATVFLDGLSFPTGVMPWGKGVLVTCAPEIFYAEDTKGTGRADLRRPLYVGFVEGNPQHRVNGLTWGLDNWIYGANGDSGGTIRSVKTGATVNIRGRDFRIRPDDGAIDAQSGQTQYGRCRDDWGNWFGCNNSAPMYQFVLADHYLRRNPYLAAPDARFHVSVTPGAAPVFPISRTLPRFNDPHAANHFTSACSIIVYRDELFGPHFAGNSFVSEPVHNLIHREIMTPQGVTFVSRRAPDEQRSEFVASSDNWFRPTMIQTGPDGAIWVADMYRQVIEHPEWIPKDWQKRLDLRAGHDKGRIYRIYPVGQRLRAIPRLDRLDVPGLVAALDSPSGWQRDLAQQLLIQRRDPAAAALLEKQVAECRRPLGRLHALCTLDGLAALEPALLEKSLADADPGVRRHAVRLSEPFLNRAPKLAAALVKLVADPDPHVRMQLAYSLGAWGDAGAGKVLAQLAIRDQQDAYITAAAMSSVTKQNLDPVLLAVLSESKGDSPPVAVVDKLFRLARILGNHTALVTVLRAVATPDDGRFASWQFATLAGLLDTLDQRDSSLKALSEEGDADVKAAVLRLSALFAVARATVTDPRAQRADQLAALRLLGRGIDRQQRDRATLAGFLSPQTPLDIRAGAVSALGQLRDARVPIVLLQGWKGYGPSTRSQVCDVLLRRDDWAKVLLDALEKHEILPMDIDAARRQRLLTSKHAALRERATKLLAGAVNPDRQKVIDSYGSALTLNGDAARGTAVFRKTCAACHRLGDVGHQVGPDLASVGDKSPQGLLIAILDPNRAVEARYINYYAVTKNGLTFTGVLANETGTSITLLGPDGQQQVILRADLDDLVSTGKSAMPEGLEKDLKPQDLADLIAYVRTAGARSPR